MYLELQGTELTLKYNGCKESHKIRKDFLARLVSVITVYLAKIVGFNAIKTGQVLFFDIN